MDDAESVIDRIVAESGGDRDCLLPLLHGLQHQNGHIDDAIVSYIAQALNISRAEVHGVISFYPDFRRVPAGAHVVKVCRAESCQARGGAAMERLIQQRLGVAMGETRADGALTLEPVYCLGLCAVGPNALVDGQPVARIDAAAVERIAAQVAA